MIKKTAALIVHKRILIIIIAVLLAAGGAVAMRFVTVNYDLSSYLPDDSSVKKGIALMTEEFGDSTYINLMIKGLGDDEKTQIPDELLTLPHVSGVTYDKDSADYNKDDNTLYVVQIAANSFSDDATEALKAIQSKFSGYEAYTEGPVNDNQYLGVAVSVMALAASLLIVILFIMCSSWVEPLLLLAAVGIAILLNEGTNLLFDSVSSLTKSIAALLQLALSMDYSIMLLDRYRQEKLLTPDKETAMKNALSKGFMAITSSSFATLVGLLCLIFMSFTIGMDLGLVLAKGVFFSLLCVLFVLPGLILMFDRLIAKTQKRALKVNLTKVSGFGYKGRWAVFIVFVLLFTGAFLLKDKVLIDFSTSSRNPDKAVIEEVFPSANTLVLLYNNQDEDKTASLISTLEDEEGVKSVSAYENTLGKQYTAAELSKTMGIDADMLQMLYSEYFKTNEGGKLSMQELIPFLLEDVANNAQFKSYFDESTLLKLQQMSAFSSPAKLKKARGSSEVAKLLGIDEATAKQLFLFYYIQHGGVSTETMNVPAFVGFLKNDVAINKQFASNFDDKTMAQIEQLSTFTDSATIKKQMKSSELAELFGMDSFMSENLYYLYYKSKGETPDWTMTISDLLDYVVNDVAQDPDLSPYITEAFETQLTALQTTLEKALSGANLSAAEISTLTGLDTSSVQLLFDSVSATSMTLTDFLSDAVASANTEISDALTEDVLARLDTLGSLLTNTLTDKALTSSQLSDLLGADESQISQLYFLYYADQGAADDWTMSPYEFVSFVITDVSKSEEYSSYFDAETLSELKTLKSVMDASLSGKSFTAAQLAKLVGMDKSQVMPLYLYYQSLYGDTSGWKLSLKTLINFINDDVANNTDYASYIDKDMLSQTGTAKIIMDAVLNGTSYTSGELADLIAPLADGLNADTTALLYKYYFSIHGADTSQTLSLYDFVTYMIDDIMPDARFSSYFTDDIKTQLSGAKKQLEDGKAALVGNNYSRMVINTTFGEESDDVYQFIENLKAQTDGTFEQTYFVGTSAVNYEMQKTFTHELNYITILTVIAVFLVVALAFRSLVIPVILVALIQCGVYMTTAVAYFQGVGTYYLALIIVQAILMGATIDYAILYTEYYRRLRKTQPIKSAIANAYTGSITTILTSSSVLFTVTLVIGMIVKDPTTSTVCMTIAKGVFIAVVLVLFILPSLLAVFDHPVCGKNRAPREEPPHA